jgi:P27 family predicted phage terminase small subunit
MRGRKPKPTALKLAEGNPGKRRINGAEPLPPRSLPDCPPHLAPEARAEWDRLAVMLNAIGLLTQVDRTTMAAYCQCYARWVEAEQKLAETPALLRMPSGYIQQSPWLTIANKSLELMIKYMAELGLTPASRSRLAIQINTGPKPWEFGEPNRIIIEAATREVSDVDAARPEDLAQPGHDGVVLSLRDVEL